MTLHLMYNYVPRDLSISDIKDTSSLASSVDELFKDLNCHCVAFRMPNEDKIIPLDIFEEKPEQLKELAARCVESIYVVEECECFVSMVILNSLIRVSKETESCHYVKRIQPFLGVVVYA